VIQKHLGLASFLLGTLVATSYAAKTVNVEGSRAKLAAWFSEAGAPFSAGLLMMGAGAWLTRRQHSQASYHAPGGTRHSPETTLKRIENAVASLPEPVPERASELHRALDEILERHVPEFLEARTALIEEHGLLKFAQLMSPFASFERYTARAWSALIDDSYDELRESLVHARQALAQTFKEYPGELAGHPSPRSTR